MLGTFVLAGDSEADKNFAPFRKQIVEFLEKVDDTGVYETNFLKLVLLEFHLEGRFLLVTQGVTLKEYRKKEQSLSCSIPVAQSFYSKSVKEKEIFIKTSILEALELVANFLQEKDSESLLKIKEMLTYFKSLRLVL